jgi:hypothetical protein
MGFFDVLEDVGSGIEDVVGGAADVVEQAAATVVDFGAKAADVVVEQAGTIAGGGLDAVGLHSLGDDVRQESHVVGNLVTQLGDATVHQFKAADDLVHGDFTGAFSQESQAAGGVASAAGNTFNANVHLVGQAVGGVLDDVGLGSVGGGIEAAADQVGSMGATAGKFVSMGVEMGGAVAGGVVGHYAGEIGLQQTAPAHHASMAPPPRVGSVSQAHGAAGQLPPGYVLAHHAEQGMMKGPEAGAVAIPKEEAPLSGRTWAGPTSDDLHHLAQLRGGEPLTHRGLDDQGGPHHLGIPDPAFGEPHQRPDDSWMDPPAHSGGFPGIDPSSDQLANTFGQDGGRHDNPSGSSYFGEQAADMHHSGAAEAPAPADEPNMAPALPEAPAPVVDLFDTNVAAADAMESTAQNMFDDLG